ncbi:MAG: glycosyltransferase, partial [Bacteroidota bacterium]
SMNNYKINNELRSQIRKRYGFIDTDIVAGIISRIAPLKGHEFIIDLATKTQHVLPHLRFLLVGDGELASNLKNEVISRHLSQNVFFCGMVAPDEIPKMINAMDFVIHPSLREGLARVLPQSIIMNRRVLTFNLDGVEEVIVNGVSGYKIEIGNVDALFEQCIKLCQEEIGKNIDERFRQSLVYEFDSSTMVEQHVNLYSSFLHS